MTGPSSSYSCLRALYSSAHVVASVIYTDIRRPPILVDALLLPGGPATEYLRNCDWAVGWQRVGVSGLVVWMSWQGVWDGVVVAVMG